MVFVRLPYEKGVKFLNFQESFAQADDIRKHLATCLGETEFSLYYNGKQLLTQQVPNDATVYVTFSLPGGKGGFGSMLRAIGAQIEKTTNREACRDLSGRRLRDINEEQRLKKWIAQEGERKAEKIRRRRERIERLKSKPKHNFVDFDYEKEISALPERVDDAVTAGIQKASKRSTEVGEASTSTCSKKKRLWLDEDISNSSSSDSEAEKSGKIASESTYDRSADHISSETSDSSNSIIAPEPVASNEPQDSKDTLNEDSIEAMDDSEAQDSKDTLNGDSTEAMEDSKDSTGVVEENKTQDTAEKSPAVDAVQSSGKETCIPEVDTGTETPQAMDMSTKTISENYVDKKEDDAPIDLMDFKSITELEDLGLNRLKSALMERGLKCGGNISDRAQRLWKVRGLQPHEYPTNLLAKKK